MQSSMTSIDNAKVESLTPNMPATIYAPLYISTVGHPCFWMLLTTMGGEFDEGHSSWTCDFDVCRCRLEYCRCRLHISVTPGITLNSQTISHEHATLLKFSLMQACSHETGFEERITPRQRCLFMLYRPKDYS
jgi:hypothetical protein